MNGKFIKKPQLNAYQIPLVSVINMIIGQFNLQHIKCWNIAAINLISGLR